MNDFQSIQAEQELLGAILQDNEIISEVAERIEAEDFFLPRHQLIFSKVLTLYKASKQVTAITLYESLQGAEIALSDLLALRDTTPSVQAYKTYVDIVKDYSKKRTIHKLCTETMEELKKTSASKVSGELTERLYELSWDKATNGIAEPAEIMQKTLEYVEMAYATKGEGVGMRTGWSQFDFATNGLSKGDLILIGARPSMGKTAFSLALLDKLMTKGYKVSLFEMEMSLEQLGIRLLCARTRTGVQKVLKGMIEDVELMHLVSEADKILAKPNLFIDASPALTLLELRNKVRKLKQQHDIDVVFVDHLGLMTPSNASKGTNDQISEISKGLKAIAKDYDVAMVALSQLNRGVESRVDKRPKLSDLRDSGSLEQDADMVMLLYRENYYESESAPVHQSTPEGLEVNIAKARNGRRGNIYFKFDMQTQRIEEKEKGR